MHGSVHHSDDALVVRHLNLEIIIDLCDATEHAFQLAVHIDHVTTMQVELIVVVCQRHVSVREVNLHHRLAWCCRLLRHSVCSCDGLLFAGVSCKSNLECHLSHLTFLTLSTLPKLRTEERGCKVTTYHFLQSLSLYGVSSTPLSLRRCTMLSSTPCHIFLNHSVLPNHFTIVGLIA